MRFPAAPYDALEVRKVTHRNGDVAARVAVRFDEIAESLRLIGAILDRLPPATSRRPSRAESAIGIGWVEGWRGAKC